MPVPRAEEPPERTLLRDHILEQLRTAILDGTLRPGERLRDEDLIGWLRTSRTPIRAALAELAGEGLVDMAPNRYTRVAVPDPDEARHVLNTLGILIGGVVRLTVPTFTDQQIAVVAVRLQQEIDDLSDTDPEAEVAARLIFGTTASYEAWLDACPNTVLADVGRRAVAGLTFELRVDTLTSTLQLEQLREGLIALRNAVEARDAIAAEQAVEYIHLLPGKRPVNPPTAVGSSVRREVVAAVA